MSRPTDNSALQVVAGEVLGYLNYSSGASDPKFLANLNKLFELLEPADEDQPAAPIAQKQPETWREVERVLHETLKQLRTSNAAFKDTTQVDAVLQLVWAETLPAYLRHHSDLLFHQDPATLFRPFFIGRVCEAVLLEGGPWDETERIVNGALNRVNDFIGYRPVPVLHNRRKHGPYPHERCRPVPLFIVGAGVAVGRYHKLVARALEILTSLDERILTSAWFDPALMDELAFDPRAYDFNHPVNKRPNYHFGLWDPHIIDQRGNYRRFVVQQTLLEALLERIDTLQTEIPRAELEEESAVVLAGTILMASGTSGNGPECHDSNVTLAKLMPLIAKYRDEYYASIMQRVEGAHLQRLQKEMGNLKQPFAGARQHLNSQLARRRALQMQHVHLAILFARLGYAESALKQADIIPAVSARMTCQLYCHLTSGWQAAGAGQIAKAADYVPQIESLLKRAINCGAVVDPWSILGFGGQFALFPAMENAIPDLRVDELLDLMEQVFALAARVWHLAAVTDDQKLCEKISKTFQRLTEWWDPFATTSVDGIKSVSGREAFAAAKRVAEALQAWYRAGAAAGKIGFWREHAEQFDSPQAFARVIEALLEKQDLASSAGLIMHWLSEADRLSLEEGLFSFHQLAQQWILQLLKSIRPAQYRPTSESIEMNPSGMIPAATVIPLQDKSSGATHEPAPKLNYTLAKFFDQLEANADTFWDVPELNLGGGATKSADEKIADLFQPPDEDQDDDDEENRDLYHAAYDEMIFRDSTADGVDSSLAESGETTDYELEEESQRITTRLMFLTTLTRLWMHTALASPLTTPDLQLTEDHLRGWLDQARRNRQKLSQLAHAIVRQPLEPQSAEHEALVEYDRRRMIKESLLERVIATSVAMAEAELFLRAVLPIDPVEKKRGAEEPEHWAPTVELWRALLRNEYSTARELWPNFLSAVRSQPLLYVPLAKGGDPRRIATARDIQQTLRVLLSQLPRWGMLRETCQLIQTARVMERDHPLGPGAVTEFDRLFEIGFKAIIECLVESSKAWNLPPDNSELADLQLIECIQQVTEALLSEWLSHSSTLRLSVLEKITNETEWKELVTFVEKYGHDLFTQRFFNLGNLRGILHQGVGNWLKQWEETAQPNEDIPLLDDLENGLNREDTTRHMQMVIESIVENFSEYRDYNATTTQSDRGEMVYMLLDFLRIKSGYERIHWNLRPVVMAHEVLVRAERVGAAELWRRTMADRTGDAADLHLKKLRQLQKKYGMRLPTIADRLAERFIRPLDIDRICALVSSAADDAKKHDASSPAFEQLEYEAGELASAPSGAGLDLPDWMAALEEEVDRVCDKQHYEQNPFQVEPHGPRVTLTWDEIQTQLTNWETKFLGKSDNEE